MNTKLYFCGDDLLGRGQYAQNLKKIILECHSYPKSNDNLSYVIGLDAPWGSGKTHFINMLLSYLSGNWIKPNLTDDEILFFSDKTKASIPNDDKTIDVIYYDAWKNDFWDNAFEPLFDLLIQADKITDEVENEDILELCKTSGKIIALCLKGFLYKKIEDYIDVSTLDDVINEFKHGSENAWQVDYQTSKMFPEYSAFCNAIDNLRRYLNKTVKKTGTKVIFIDELDRCKPTFAVQTLEIVKHLFNVEGLVFVFSLDMQQLSHSVKSVYGNEFDSIGYLERFFNYLTLLPHMNESSMITSYFTELGFDMLNSQVKTSFETILKSYHLSLREIRTILCTYFVLHKTVLKQYENIYNAQILYLYFLTMKYKYPTLFSNTVIYDNIEKINSMISNIPIPFLDASQKAYQAFQKVISDNKTIEHSSYLIISSGKPVDGKMKQIDILYDNQLSFKNGDTVQLTDDMSLSLILYLSDIKDYNIIKNYTALQYILRQLELCDFI